LQTLETSKESKPPWRISPRRAEVLAEEAALAGIALAWLKKPPVYPKATDGGGGNGDVRDTEEDLPFPAAIKADKSHKKPAARDNLSEF
jgi:hypothetical protein